MTDASQFPILTFKSPIDVVEIQTIPIPRYTEREAGERNTTVLPQCHTDTDPTVL